MHKYGTLCDEFYVNMQLGTEMELPQNREAVLHFFEQIQKLYPRMTNFYAREKGEFCLEAEKEGGQYSWVSTEPRRLSSGTVNPESVEAAILQHQSVLQLMPFELSISHLDCESLSFVLGFDFTYRGNQNELVAEALGMMPALERLADFGDCSLLSYEPAIQLALDDECKTQCRLSFETRTTAYQVRSGDYSEDPLSVYLTLRRYESLGKDEDYATELRRLAQLGEKMVDDYLVEHVLRPLQQTIALR